MECDETVIELSVLVSGNWGLTDEFRVRLVDHALVGLWAELEV